MAKGKYQYWLTSEGLTLLEGWARDGLTEEQISHNMDISRSTLKDWKLKYPAISATLKKGKEVVDYRVENALLSAALEGNTTAQIFWLKNRRPDKWRDKPEESRGAQNAETNAQDDLMRAIKEAVGDAD